MRTSHAAALVLVVGATQGDPLASRAKGSVTAPVTVYEMADFECPACRSFALETFPQLEREYVRTGKVRWIFINYPLTAIHPHAVAAAEVAMCAGRQGLFWEMHDALFIRQPAWTALSEPGPYLVALAESAGVARNELLPCLERRATRQEIEADARRARTAGARSTPTFYIDGELLVGAAPAAVFREVLDSLHRRKSAADRR